MSTKADRMHAAPETIKQSIDQPLASPQEREVLTALKELRAYAQHKHGCAKIYGYREESGGHYSFKLPHECDCTCGLADILAAIAKAESAPSVGQQESEDSLGLSIDMLDVDRLRQWANNLLVYGNDVSQWGDRIFVAGKMQTLATSLEHAIKDIGTLRQRAQLASSVAAAPAWRAMEEENKRLTDAILWALGENGQFSEEPEPLAGKYRRRYWWRTELRARAFGPLPRSPRAGEDQQP